MSYRAKLGKDDEIPLPDKLCSELGIKIGDILICESADDSSTISLKKHINQELSDEEIAASGNLTRVIQYKP